FRGIENDFAGDGGAAGRVDAEDNGLDLVVGGGLIQGLADGGGAGLAGGAEDRRLGAAEHDRAFDVDDADGGLVAGGLLVPAEQVAKDLDRDEVAGKVDGGLPG